MPTGLNILEVVVAILLSFAGLIAALGKVLQAVRNKWIEDNRNTEALTANTEAVRELSRTVASQSAQLNEFSGRMARVEQHLRIGK